MEDQFTRQNFTYGEVGLRSVCRGRLKEYWSNVTCPGSVSNVERGSSIRRKSGVKEVKVEVVTRVIESKVSYNKLLIRSRGL